MIKVATQIVKSFGDYKREEDLLKIVSKLENTEVLVGIPEEKAPRNEGEVNNASLLYLHSKGSPLQDIPARPVIEPALEASGNKERVQEDLKKITKLLLDGKVDQARRMMDLAGQDAVNMIKAWFTDSRNGWPPNSPLTVLEKLDKRFKSVKKKRELYRQYKMGKTGINTVLVDTGQMRNAITYVVRNKEND